MSSKESSINRRYLSLDFLRGLTIFGMVFSAIIPYGVLPAWMYHVQNPPPTHELNMSVSGIGWVDLVFPIFIFCMGAAIPFAGRGKLAKSGKDSASRSAFTKRFVAETFERFVMLWLFSYLYVLLDVSNSLFTLLGFCALFPIYLVIKSKGSYVKWVRVLGYLLTFSLVFMGAYFFDEAVNVQRRGIIIFLLAFLYLFGALIWYFTRDNLKARVAAFFAVLLFTIVTQYANWPVTTYANENIRWWFNVEYVYFLLLLLPATYVGDVLYNRNTIYHSLRGNVIHFVFPLLALFVVWLCYAFYMRLCWINLIVSGVVLVVLWFVIKAKLSQYKSLFLLAASLLFCALIIDLINGGIKKVPCTIEYCLATFSISLFLLMVSDYICKYLSNSFIVSVFTGAGKNPLMSYIAFNSCLVPVMNITGFIAIYKWCAPVDMPLLGVLRAAIAVLFTMWLVSLCSKRGIFWKA